jgi:hypothetical protein
MQHRRGAGLADEKIAAAHGGAPKCLGRRLSSHSSTTDHTAVCTEPMEQIAFIECRLADSIVFRISEGND